MLNSPKLPTGSMNSNVSYLVFKIDLSPTNAQKLSKKTLYLSVQCSLGSTKEFSVNVTLM